jgi:hypothetical protein
MDRPASRPQTKPGDGGFIEMPTSRPQQRPETRPAEGGMFGKPQRPEKPKDRPYQRPGDSLQRPVKLPGVAERPNRRPEVNRPRPVIPDKPGRPRPQRPSRPDRWQNVDVDYDKRWNNWQQNNKVVINQYNDNRVQKWNNIHRYQDRPDWYRSYRSDEYRHWRHEVLDYRCNRGFVVWNQCYGYHDGLFDNHWWGSCAWVRPRPVLVSVNVSPWWHWRPLAWVGIGAFFQAAIAPQPVVYDPGTTIVYQGDVVYVNGVADSKSAKEYRQEARELATPALAEVPVPVAAEEGEAEEWLPTGVWALTQQEQGDAVMFMQISVNKQGVVAGAYKNVMTGDEQPLIGQLNLETQVMAWHVGDATQSIYETSVSSLTGDVASVFVHFGEEQTQTWLLVRLPSPEMPPGSVRLPEYEKSLSSNEE